jgi:HEPN domain-containing protein
MSDMTDEWIAKAESDYTLASLAMSAGEAPVLDGVCFHAQQCAEKYLKAFLTEHQCEFPRTHVLSALLDLCLSLDPTFETLRADLASLEGYAVAARYPGVRLTAEMAHQALTAMQHVRAFIRPKLNLT